MKIFRAKKIISSFLLITVAGSLFLNFTFLLRPQKAEALSLGTLPTKEIGGRLTQQTIDVSGFGNQIIQSAINSAMKALLQKLSVKLAKEVQEQFGIKDYDHYQSALREGGGLAAVYRKLYGEDSVPVSTQGDISRIAADFENLPLNRTYSRHQAAQLGAAQARRRNPNLQKNVNLLLVGASSLFTSSISCGGINGRAIENTANYLAAASAGILASQISPASGTKYYEDMLKLGGPFATPPFWQLAFQDTASAIENRATQAATLQIVSPGLKATQVQTESGETQIKNSQSLITRSQTKAFDSLFDSAYLGANSTMPSFASYMALVISQYALDKLLDKLSTGFGGLIGKILTPVLSARWVLLFRAFGQLVAKNITKNFVSALYDNAIALIYQGKVLAESAKCRQPSRFTDSASAINTTPTTTSTVIFSADPNLFIKGDPVNTTTFTWDATSLGTVTSISIDKVGEYRIGPLALSGAVTDEPFRADEDPNKTSQEYRLEIDKGLSTEVILSLTVELVESAPPPGSIDFSGVTFDVQPRSAASGDSVLVTWDASSVPGASVSISPPIVSAVLPVSGSASYTVSADTDFVMTTSASNGDRDTKAIRVTVSSGIAGVSTPDYLSPAFKVRE